MALGSKTELGSFKTPNVWASYQLKIFIYTFYQYLLLVLLIKTIIDELAMKKLLNYWFTVQNTFCTKNILVSAK